MSLIPGIFKIGMIVCALGGGLLLVVLIVDVHEDRSYRVVITGAVTVYAEPVLPDENHPNKVVEVLSPRDQPEVRRISRQEGWVRIRLRDRREGYIFLDAKFELRPR